LGEFFERSQKIRGKLLSSFFLFDSGEFVSSSGMLLFSLASKKAVDKRAVVRNRARRRLREVMKQVATELPPPLCGRRVTWVGMATRMTAASDWGSLRGEVRWQWEKILSELNKSSPAG
jgi:hypothetical protein